MFVCSEIRIWRRVAETISLLVMKAFVCGVKSYLEVGNRDYLIASDKRIHLLFLEVGLETPQKRTETKGKKFLKKLHSS